MTTLVLPASLTHDGAAACSRMLGQAVRALGDGQAIADASVLERFDSSALAVLLECRREALAHGKGFAVRGLPARLRALAVLYGVDGLLPPAA
ncbi:STAS domain-containing protein [Ramlibacter rhizophilus]|uniref:STAS domain-containing protein n=1 Tax=Ramlibacter rhizophilus TaxID=1781167 RepID=A0A4Z0BMI3_9BURK|nr:STAS domain-containing protein [Ramlibacter rhizophilus]TFY99619.1 STAS domain-containing protein [Ramlibacter rhizophilus]